MIGFKILAKYIVNASLFSQTFLFIYGYFSSFCHFPFSFQRIQVQTCWTCWTWWLQVIKNILWSKFCIYFFFQASTNEIGQFVSIPTRKSKLIVKLQKIEFKKTRQITTFDFFFKFYTPARSWYTDGSRPIIVQVCQLVGQDLNPIWRPTRFVQDDVVRCGVDGTLTNRLADEVEVIPEIYQIGQKLHKEQKWTICSQVLA